MNTLKLTMAAVAKLPAPAAGKVAYRDRDMPGLYLTVTSRGVKTFSMVKRIGSRIARITLGRYPALNVEKARLEVTRLSGQIAEGKDPATRRRQARQELTLEALWPLYLEKYAKPRKRTWAEDERQWNAYLLPLKNRQLSDITRANVRDWHASMGKKHGLYQANRALALLSGMFNFGRDEGFEGENPCRGLKRFKEQSRERFLAADELRELFKSLDADLPVWRDFFAVLLLTGARGHNVRAMRWDEVELERGLWRIPGEKFKTGEPVVVILVDAVVGILKARRAAAEPEAEYVFPGRGGACISYPQAAWRRIVKRAGLKNLRPHDLRRTLASWGVAAGASLYAVGKALGHRDAATTQIYARLDVGPIRTAVGLATGALLAALAVPDPERKELTPGALPG